MNLQTQPVARSTNPTNPLSNLLAQRYTPLFRHSLNSQIEATLATESFLRRQKQNFKLLRRWLVFKTSGQASLLHEHLPAPPARILWLNFLNNRIGDSIMDLSGRALLGAFEVDLLTDKSQAELFATDRYFKNVFSNPALVDPSRYDFALVDYINTESLRLKRKWFPALPFASLYGFFSGPEVNRTLFSCYRIHHLLRYPHTEVELQRFLTPQIFIEDERSPLPTKDGRKRVALALGGLNPYRTYGKWAEMILHLRKIWPLGKPFPQFILVGSENGRQSVESIKTALAGCEVISLVGTLSLRATARVISDTNFYVGADGGLMHCAIALKLPGVALFGNHISPDFRLPPGAKLDALEAADDVNSIAATTLAEKFLTGWERWLG